MKEEIVLDEALECSECGEVRCPSTVFWLDHLCKHFIAFCHECYPKFVKLIGGDKVACERCLKVLASQKKYREEHRGERSVYSKRYRAKHPTELAAYNKVYYLENRDRIRARKRALSLKRKAEKEGK